MIKGKNNISLSNVEANKGVMIGKNRWWSGLTEAPVYRKEEMPAHLNAGRYETMHKVSACAVTIENWY